MTLAGRQIVTLSKSSAKVPPRGAGEPASKPSRQVWPAGSVPALDRETTALFCSSRCPGSIILETFDAITALRSEARVLIGGFQSPMEWECLGIVLRGKQPAIWVPACSIEGMRLKPELKAAFQDGRLLILSSLCP